MEWAAVVKGSSWDFPAETVSGGQNGYTDGGLSVYRLSLSLDPGTFSQTYGRLLTLILAH